MTLLRSRLNQRLYVYYRASSSKGNTRNKSQPLCTKIMFEYRLIYKSYIAINLVVNSTQKFSVNISQHALVTIYFFNKHHIDDVPKSISDLFQTNDNYHSYSTRNSQALRTPIGKSEAIYQTFTYIGSLAWNYIFSKIPTDVSYICFKNIAKLHVQANNLPQIRLNV